MRNAIHSKGRCVRGTPQTDGAPIAVDVIQTVWNGASQRILLEIMGIHQHCFLTPNLPGIFEVANQFFFLGIYTQLRGVLDCVVLTLFLNVLELVISLWMLGVGIPLLAIRS